MCCVVWKDDELQPHHTRAIGDVPFLMCDLGDVGTRDTLHPVRRLGHSTGRQGWPCADGRWLHKDLEGGNYV
jgi:hypothetical protein